MKKIFTLLLIAGLTLGLFAQTLTTTNPMLKNAILEEFTGIHCTYCPDGHAIAQSILNNNPGRAFTIAIHQGSFAVPSTGEPDYRTIFGDPIANQTGLTGYPSGTVNRHVFTGNTTALGRSAWSASCDQIMQELSPVNLGLSSQYEASTRTLTIDVELYYTADAPASVNYINVALTQDSIYGPQTGGGAGSNYRHMHMLRHMITGQWGDEVTTTAAGSLVNRTYTYVVPESFNNIQAVVENMKVVAFVAEDHQEVYTGDQVKAIGGTNLFIGEITSQEPYIQKGSNGTELTFNIEAESNITGTEPFELWIESENAPVDWQVSFTVDGNEYTGSTTVNLTKGISTPVTVNITPGSAAGFPGYVIRMRSVNFPSAPEKSYRVMAVAGVTDLLVNGMGGPEAVTHQGVYLDGFEASGISSYAVVNANVMRDMINSDAYQGVYNCWLNIAWTFPALTDSQAESVMDFMDAGHNIFIAGQDIGWDIMSGVSGSNGTPVTQDFYTNYLKAGYIDDGSSVNNKLNANPNDSVFGAVPQSNIIDVYGGNMYPEVISALPGADVIFNYNVATKNAAIKYDGTYRSIYFGIGLEMISNVDVRNEIINLSRQWLSAEIVGVEFNEAVNALLNGQNYPNPANDHTWIAVSKDAIGGTLEIYNMRGNKVLSMNIGSELLYKVHLHELSSGIYTYRIVNGNVISGARKLIIVR